MALTDGTVGGVGVAFEAAFALREAEVRIFFSTGSIFGWGGVEEN